MRQTTTKTNIQLESIKNLLSCLDIKAEITTDSFKTINVVTKARKNRDKLIIGLQSVAYMYVGDNFDVLQDGSIIEHDRHTVELNGKEVI